MAAAAFNIGDKVCLNSGGPVMTVVAIPTAGTYTCMWFVQGLPRKSDFPGATLVAA